MARRKQLPQQNKRRKGFLSVALPWAQRFGVILTVSVVVLWLAAWIFVSGAGSRSADWARNQIVQASGKAGFRVENLLLEGREFADADFLKVLINVSPGDPLFSLSPAKAKALLEETEWVAHAHIERRLPDTIYIRITERKPTALWLAGNTLYLVDENGDPIKTDNLERFKDLVIVSGDGARGEVPDLTELLKAEPTITARVYKALRVGHRRWDLVLDNGLVLKLPEDDDAGLALRRAEEAQQKTALFDRPGLQVVDLRQDDRLVLRNQPGMARIPSNAIPAPFKRGDNQGGNI